MKNTTKTTRTDDSSSSEAEDASSEEAGRTGATKQPARRKNIEALVAYFESGITEQPGRIGIELEHTIVDAHDLAPVSYSQDEGIEWLLGRLACEYETETRDEQGDLLGLSRKDENITLEPAAQLELSAGPFGDLGEAYLCFTLFEKRLAELLGPVGKKAVLTGYHPTARAEDLELIPKRRYKFMNLYFSEFGTYGLCMMRGSASTQISIDYSSVEDCLRKLKLAFALTPLFSLICDNAAVFEGLPRKHKLVRTKIWQECDPDRCGLIPGVMGKGFTLHDYAAYILDTPAILVPCETHEWCYTEKTFGELYAAQVMDRIAIEHAVSMFFNDVRLKTYIEIRPADSLPIPFVIAYAALIKGLFYQPENLDELDALFAHVGEAEIDAAKEALMEEGYDAEVYGHPVADVVDRLMVLARKGLTASDKLLLGPLEDLTARRVTLADMSERSQTRA